MTRHDGHQWPMSPSSMTHTQTLDWCLCVSVRRHNCRIIIPFSDYNVGVKILYCLITVAFVLFFILHCCWLCAAQWEQTWNGPSTTDGPWASKKCSKKLSGSESRLGHFFASAFFSVAVVFVVWINLFCHVIQPAYQNIIRINKGSPKSPWRKNIRLMYSVVGISYVGLFCLPSRCSFSILFSAFFSIQTIQTPIACSTR